MLSLRPPFFQIRKGTTFLQILIPKNLYRAFPTDMISNKILGAELNTGLL